MLLVLDLIADSLAETINTKSRLDNFFNDTATTEIYTLSLHDALPIAITTPIEGDDLVNGAEATDVVDEGTTDPEDGQTVNIVFTVSNTATVTATGDQPTVDAERRARVEAELADLRRQLARLRAVWTPEADEVVDDVVDAGAEVADGTDVGGGSSPAVAVDAAGDVDWGAVAKSRALWSPGADDSSGAETSSSSPAAPGASAGETDGTIVVGAAATREGSMTPLSASSTDLSPSSSSSAPMMRSLSATFI